MLYYFLVGLSVACIAVQFSLTKVFQTRAGSTAAVTLCFTMASGGVSCLFFLCASGFNVQFSAFSVSVALLFALTTGLNGILGIMAVSCGRVAVFTLFMMLGGMLLPFLYGAVFLNEYISGFRIAGVVLLALSLLLPMLEKPKEGERNKKRFYALCAAVFVLNGAVSILSKFHQTDSRAVDTFSYLVYSYAFVFAVSAIAFGSLAFARKLNARKRANNPTDCPASNAPASKRSALAAVITWGTVAAYALISGVVYMLQLFGASHLPASVMYPLVTGGTVVLTALAGWLFFKEKPSVWVLCGMGVTVIATVLFLF